MDEKQPIIKIPNRLPLIVAIVGGGRACKFFLELFQSDAFPYLDIKLAGVCDLDLKAEGLQMAQEMGVYTTDNFRDLFLIKNLDYIIELTGDRQVSIELIRMRPKGVGIIEHNVSRFLRDLITINKQLKSIERQLIHEKMAFNFLVQQSSSAIVVLSTDFTIVDANETYLMNVNRSREEVVGSNCYKILHGLDAPCAMANPILKCPMIETMKTGKSSHFIHELNETNNKKSYGNIITYPLKNQNEEIVKIIEIWQDITEEISLQWKRRGEELKADLNKIIQEDRMISLGKLAASCVHQINNPIQGLLTFSNLMQNILSEEIPNPESLNEFRKHLSLMSSELERCGKIVSGLLSFSRSSTTVYSDVDVNEILREIVTLTKHKMTLQNIQLNTAISDQFLMVQGDKNQLQQCFLNLLFNAIEAMPTGGRLDLISKIDIEQNKVRIEIKDTGTGIHDKDIENIFDPFFTTKEEGEGTGLGLSIVYGVVKNHRGHIKVNSQVGKGCTFILHFPVSKTTV